MRSIGLTGGIASGKSTVSAILAELGATVIDADAVGHQLYAPGSEIARRVAAAFGAEVVASDGTIVRHALGARVFDHPDQLKRLTDIVWPALWARLEDELRRLANQGADVVVLEAAVLLEAGWHDLVDEIWVTSVPPALARKRVMARDGWSAAEADRRLRSQFGNAEREARADLVLRTDRPRDALRAQVEEAWRALRARLVATA